MAIYHEIDAEEEDAAEDENAVAVCTCTAHTSLGGTSPMQATWVRRGRPASCVAQSAASDTDKLSMTRRCVRPAKAGRPAAATRRRLDPATPELLDANDGQQWVGAATQRSSEAATGGCSDALTPHRRRTPHRRLPVPPPRRTPSPPPHHHNRTDRKSPPQQPPSTSPHSPKLKHARVPEPQPTRRGDSAALVLEAAEVVDRARRARAGGRRASRTMTLWGWDVHRRRGLLRVLLRWISAFSEFPYFRDLARPEVDTLLDGAKMSERRGPQRSGSRDCSPRSSRRVVALEEVEAEAAKSVPLSRRMWTWNLWRRGCLTAKGSAMWLLIAPSIRRTR
ncbi:hypothetical protein DFH09DRAFT_1073146 [Mycena vulgaris]|nr:hypothetical protein DFH09DRAFT_1073146 [Mycena vulgaris]